VLKELLCTAPRAAAIEVNLMRLSLAMNLSIDIAKELRGNSQLLLSTSKREEKWQAMMRRGIEQSSIVF
jgi:hypothetical protein